MNKVYRLSFYPLVLVCLFLINIWNISKSQLTTEIKLEKKKNEERIKTLFSSNIMKTREIKDISLYSILDGSKLRIINKDSTYLVILLSDFDCRKCQENELLNLQKIREQFEERGIKIICITIKEKVNKITSEMKYLRLNIPLNYVENEIYYNTFSFFDKYPQILLIANGYVTKIFKPISGDLELSKMFYDFLLLDI
ncbi:MAG: hypothetical protein GYA14_05535 [Ignavibacteria bacterium]|nr:hypothetical protein [Ignavibacteria bacterium]